MSKLKIGKRNIIGFIILLLGIIILSDTLGIFDGYEFLRTYWPLALIVFGLITFFEKSSNKVFSLILISVGIFAQLKKLGYIPEEMELTSLILPILLIIIGLWFLFPKKKFRTTSSTLNSSIIFAGGNIHNSSTDFRGGELTTVFGGLDVDLREAQISTIEPAVIDLFAAFGGIDIKVPDNWIVETKCIPLFGGWDNKKKAYGNTDPNAPRLIIKGMVLFGGFDVK